MTSLTGKRLIRNKKPKPMREGVFSMIFDIFIYTTMISLVIVTLYPFLNIIAYSLNDAMDSLRGGITIFPRIFTWNNYAQIFKDSQIISATMVSIARTSLGAFSTTLCCLIVAYTISRKEFILKGLITKVLIISMYFSGGLIPYYLLMKSMGLIGTFWIYIIPALVASWNIMIMKSYITSSISDSLIESARIDGASEFRTLFTIILPLSLPVIATVVLFTSVGQWNSWFDVYLYNNTKRELSTLQFELQKLLQKTMISTSGTSAKAAADSASQAGQSGSKTITPQATRAAMTVVATLPILLVYPFLQRYFIHGLTLGGIKG